VLTALPQTPTSKGRDWGGKGKGKERGGRRDEGKGWKRRDVPEIFWPRTAPAAFSLRSPLSVGLGITAADPNPPADESAVHTSLPGALRTDLILSSSPSDLQICSSRPRKKADEERESF